MTPVEILQLALQLNLTQHVDQCVDPHQRATGKAIADTYTAIVDTLRRACPNESIRALASALWDAVNSGKVRTAMFDPLPSIHFWVYREPAKRGGREVATILMPTQWLDAMRANPIFCIGGVVCTGSQAVSWVRASRTAVGHTQLDSSALNARARAYEAEFLLMVASTDPEYRFDEYQRQVLAAYPQGLASTHGS